MIDKNNVENLVPDQFKDYKLYLFAMGFVYNPSHLVWQKIYSRTDEYTVFYNVIFRDSDLTITLTKHPFEKIDSYHLDILFHGKIPDKIIGFKSLVVSIISKNKVVNNSVVRHLISLIEKNNFNSVNVIDKLTIKTYDKDNNEIIKYHFIKNIGDYTIQIKFYLPENKILIMLHNEELKNQVALLDCFLPDNNFQLNNILYNIPLLFHDY